MRLVVAALGAGLEGIGGGKGHAAGWVASAAGNIALVVLVVAKSSWDGWQMPSGGQQGLASQLREVQMKELAGRLGALAILACAPQISDEASIHKFPDDQWVISS